MKFSRRNNNSQINIQHSTIRYAEMGLVIFVWLVLLITPILFREDNNNPLSRSVLNQLEILIPLSILFLINRFILVPRLLFKRKPLFFILSVLGLILLLTIGSYVYYAKIKQTPPSLSIETGNNPRSQPDFQPDGSDQQALPPQSRQPRPVPPFANFLILSVLVVGFDTGLRSALRWINVENEKVRLEKENVATQLTLLRTQVSPHFFMNTLNNIHALVDTNTTEAKEAIIKLSKMMRYLLYETETEKTTLKKEIEFLESYINLMKLRFSEKVRITLNLPATVPDASIPPFLFTSFIENAFKHGISYKNESFITIDLITGNERLLFIIKNSKTENNHNHEFPGIGIENTRKRLNLLYGNNYHLDIIDTIELFTVNLSVPL